MALYDYDLYLVREADKGAIVPDVQRLGLIEQEAESIVLPFGVHAEWTEVENRVHLAAPVRIAALALEGREFESVLQRSPDAFLDWLWTVAEGASLAYAFISSGSAGDYYQAGGLTDQMVFTQVGELVSTGKVRIVHPLMLFATRLGEGRTCQGAQAAPLYWVSSRQGVGCLLLLMEGDPQRGPLEILDPGSMYGRLRHHFDPGGKVT